MTPDEARTHVLDALTGFASPADLETLSPDVPLRDALELDSLDFLSFVEQLSESTGVRLEESDYPALTTTAACVQLLTTGRG